MKVAAIASLTRILYRNTSQTNKPEEFVRPIRRADLNGMANTASRMSDWEQMCQGVGAYAPGVPLRTESDDDEGSEFDYSESIQMGLGDFTGYCTKGAAFVSRLAPDNGGVGEASYQGFLATFAMTWLSRILRPFGFFLSPKYSAYLRRVCGREEYTFIFGSKPSGTHLFICSSAIL
jgi:hypothetical protein